MPKDSSILADKAGLIFATRIPLETGLLISSRTYDP